MKMFKFESITGSIKTMIALNPDRIESVTQVYGQGHCYIRMIGADEESFYRYDGCFSELVKQIEQCVNDERVEVSEVPGNTFLDTDSIEFYMNEKK